MKEELVERVGFYIKCPTVGCGPEEERLIVFRMGDLSGHAIGRELTASYARGIHQATVKLDLVFDERQRGGTLSQHDGNEGRAEPNGATMRDGLQGFVFGKVGEIASRNQMTHAKAARGDARINPRNYISYHKTRLLKAFETRAQMLGGRKGEAQSSGAQNAEGLLTFMLGSEDNALSVLVWQGRQEIVTRFAV